ncbi:hypothetical protein TPY_2828 [Sulfobacillus acidophilus TPY]|nr:hypothetical protein TPY_2828 [Sulfobacillus acidophilus TPY]
MWYYFTGFFGQWGCSIKKLTDRAVLPHQGAEWVGTNIQRFAH